MAAAWQQVSDGSSASTLNNDVSDTMTLLAYVVSQGVKFLKIDNCVCVCFNGK